MISIIIPTKNEEKIIGQTLKNLCAGLEEIPYELIVSDGRSSDKTIAIAKKYADCVVVYGGTARQTIGQGRNMGAAGAKGNYFVFLDADVTIPRPDDFFAKAISLFENNPRLVAVTGPIRVLPECATFWDKIIFGGLNLSHRISNNVFHVGKAAGEFQIVRATAFKKLGGYREDLAASEDYEFFYRLSRIGETRYVPDLAVYHTGRRAHAIGWPKLLTIWIRNALSVKYLKRSVSKEWEEVR